MFGSGRRRVAVIGSGVSGLTAGYALRRSADVTLYEADDRLGGHAHTHEIADNDGTHFVDSGFIVHNRRTYPLLCKLFDELGVTTRSTEMSMSVRCRGCGLEYCGARGFAGLFARSVNAADPRFLALLAQVPLFYARARKLLARPLGGEEPTLGEFLADGGYTRYFVQHFVVPLVSAVWSCGPHLVTRYPARYLFTFLAHHGMLTVNGSPAWRTVTGGSRRYVELVAERLGDVRTATPVRSVLRDFDGVQVRDAADKVSRFDAVVIATHPDQALRMLSNPSVDEKSVLSSFEYSRNQAILHTDAGVLPRRMRARGGWNYLLPSCTPPPGEVRVSYSLNRLQRLSTRTDYVVTLGGMDIDPDSVIDTMDYEHPVYTSQVLAAQRRLPELNDTVTAYAGAYHGWGFHEDGCRSGVAAAESLGASW